LPFEYRCFESTQWHSAIYTTRKQFREGAHPLRHFVQTNDPALRKPKDAGARHFLAEQRSNIQAIGVQAFTSVLDFVTVQFMTVIWLRSGEALRIGIIEIRIIACANGASAQIAASTLESEQNRFFLGVGQIKPMRKRS
jgi:hypothetical protein